VHVLQQNNQKLALAIILHFIHANNTSYSPYISIYLTTCPIHYNQAHNTTTGQPSSHPSSLIRSTVTASVRMGGATEFIVVNIAGVSEGRLDPA